MEIWTSTNPPAGMARVEPGKGTLLVIPAWVYLAGLRLGSSC